jgi:imidazolonepropionase-like amidohydrolase
MMSVANRKIAKIGEKLASASSDVKDAHQRGAADLPGLIDSHTHLLLDVVVPPEALRWAQMSKASIRLFRRRSSSRNSFRSTAPTGRDGRCNRTPFTTSISSR